MTFSWINEAQSDRGWPTSLHGHVALDVLVEAELRVALVGAAVDLRGVVEVVIRRRRRAGPLERGRAPGVGCRLLALGPAYVEVDSREHEAQAEGEGADRRQLMQPLKLGQVVVI